MLKLPTSYRFALSRNQNYVAALGQNVALANIKSRTRIAAWHPLSHPSHAAFNHSEAKLAVKNTVGELAILDVANGAVLVRHCSKQRDEGASIHFSACDRYLVDGSWSGVVRVRQASDLKLTSEYAYPEEMITEVSPSYDRQVWLFAHQPKTPAGLDHGLPPYVSIWSWPLRTPFAKVELGMDNLYSVALSPCGSYIAAVGYSRNTLATEIRVLAIDGSVVASSATSIGGTGSSTRWSPGGELLGTVTSSGFAVLLAPSLQKRATFEVQYPSDIAFIDGSTSVLLGTWTSGTVAELPLQ